MLIAWTRIRHSISYKYLTDVATLVDRNPTIGTPLIPRKCCNSLRAFISNLPASCPFVSIISHPFSPAMSKLSTKSWCRYPFCQRFKDWISSRSNEADFKEKGVDFLVPDLCCLFQSVKKPQEPKNEILPSCPHDSFRLYYEDLFIQFSKQICHSEVGSMDLPLFEHRGSKVMRYTVNLATGV